MAKFVLQYAPPHFILPDAPALARIEVTLGRTDKGYVAPREGVPAVTRRLDELAAPSAVFYESALTTVAQKLAEYFNSLGVIGVVVGPAPEDIDPKDGADLRGQKLPASERDVLRLNISIARVAEVRTMATGNRIVSQDQRLNNAVHRFIRDASPVRPPLGGLTEGDLLDKASLDEYIFALNRHSGRRVDVSLAPAGPQGETALEYLVNEDKPWLAYYQLSNTGTKQTNEWRSDFGFTHSQLTGRDDTLSLDYATTGVFEKSHAITGSYELPLIRPDVFRLRLNGSWSQYTASEVGISNENFVGQDWIFGAEGVFNIFQHRELFIDAFAGARWHHARGDNQPAKVEGADAFFIPAVGLRLERVTLPMTTLASVGVEGNVPEIAGTDKADLPKLGRLNVSDRWTLVRWQMKQSLYLEPLLFPVKPDAPLVHEVSLAFHGQASLDYRLVPQEEQTAGGLYTVRGYTESAAVGDTVWIGNFEYAFHFPRNLAPQAEPARLPLLGDFRVRPTPTLARPDWDLIFRAFFDAGQTTNVHRLRTEKDADLYGTGVGAEFDLFHNFSFRCDLGVPLKDAGGVRAGDPRLHVAMTISF